jgi:2-methylcitrate dehydratase PrpD
VQAALLARAGLTASAGAIDGPQGLLAAMDSENPSLDAEAADLGRRWEILDTGITVKLYPSCAGTHPALDAVLDLRRELQLSPDDVDSVVVDVDRITPTILLYDRPATGLEGKFSLPFCVAAALVFGRVGIDTFEPTSLHDSRVQTLLPRVTMRVDSTFDDGGPALTRARVHLRRRDGETIVRNANGARGYPATPASAEELDAKFLACARRVLPAERAASLLNALRALAQMDRATRVFG